MWKYLLILSLFTLTLSQENISPQQQQLSMKRTACLVLSRYHSNHNKQYIDEVMSGLSPDDQQKYISKLYVIAIEQCMPRISIEEAQQFFVENSQFNPGTLFYLFDSFDYSAPAQNLDEELTQVQKHHLKFIKQFDEEMQVKKQEKEAEAEETIGDEDFSVFWFTGKDIPKQAKIAYIVVFIGIAIAGLYWGFSNLQNSKREAKKRNKRRKSPKQN